MRHLRHWGPLRSLGLMVGDVRAHPMHSARLALSALFQIAKEPRITNGAMAEGANGDVCPGAKRSDFSDQIGMERLVCHAARLG